MVWSQLSINKPHLVYIILGGFTSIFMLVSLFIKEKLYIGEATVATICGLIFGPHGANLINPLTWGNTDQITLEFSRIVLVVQCFAVGVELPKAYMERHWLSVVMLLVPVMTFGWLVTSLFVWWMIEPLSWLESLCVAACVTATDPVLASSVVGKGKFAKRVPKHIRDLLSAESGCNDGMAFPFIYLALYLIHYNLDAAHVTQHWIVNTILYECIWGAVYGVLVGYIARQAIKWAENRGIIDRESFLVFYFVLALFCAGSGSMLGMDDLLVGFAAGVGFSNDGWFTEKTEESHVSNVIDLLLNLTYFVYLGTIIPWDQYNSGLHGLEAWRLVVIALLVVFFRRIPIMLALKPVVPDIKTWREALFCGHFGPIGVGAIFVAILARAELETGGTTPLAVLPDPSDAEYVLIYTIWPITTFLVITSIVVHGSSIAVFTLGKRINTLTLTLSYTQGNDKSSNWMERLPRIASRSKSQGRSFNSEYSEDEKAFPPGQLPPVGVPQLALRRQKDEDYEREKPIGRPHIRSRSKRRKRKSAGAGGPISDSAIHPQRRSDPALVGDNEAETPGSQGDRPSPYRLDSDQLEKLQANDSDPETVRRRKETEKEVRKGAQSDGSGPSDEPDIEVFEERDHIIIEDTEGNVIDTIESRGKSDAEKAAIIDQARARLKNDDSGRFTKHKHESHPKDEEKEIEDAAADTAQHPEKHFRDHFKGWKGFGLGRGEQDQANKKPERKRGPAHAYQFGNTIIVEDEDGEVIHKYEIPREDQEPNKYNDYMREQMHRMGTWVGLARRASQAPGPSMSEASHAAEKLDDVENTSTSSPEKDKNELEPVKTAPAETKSKRPAGGREPSGFQDDGLRIAISHADQYGLTGLRKTKTGDRPGMELGGGRRLSTVDFIKSMQQLDHNKRSQVMDEAGMSKEKQDDVHRSVQRTNEKERDRPKTPGRTKTPGEDKSEDYFSRPTGDTGRRRVRSDTDESRRPEPTKTNTGASLREEDEEEEEDVPVHNVRSTLNRHGKGNMTSAEARRERFRQSVQPIHEGGDEADSDEETAAEKKRRLAALGLGGGGESDSSEDEDSPRVRRRAVQEPDHPAPPAREREKPAEPPKMRIQWGANTTGVVRGKGGDEEEAGESGPRASGGLGKKLKGFLDK